MTQIEDFSKWGFNFTSNDLEQFSKISQSNQPNNIDYLWQEAESEIMPMLYSRCSIYFMVKIGDHNVKCLIDTGAETNIITTNTVKKLDLFSYVDHNYKGLVSGIGTGTIVGFIPYLILNIDGLNCGACLTVYENEQLNFDIILGLPFMMLYQVTLDFKNRFVNIMDKKTQFYIQEH